VTDSDVAAAEQEAETAAQRLTELEHQVLHAAPADRPAAGVVVEQRHLAEFARRRVALAEERAARASAQQRLDSLAEIGQQIDALATEAEGPAAAIRAAMLTALAETAGNFRASCAAHDAAVRELASRAGRLRLVQVAGGRGPNPENGGVKVLGPPPSGGIAHDDTAVAAIAHLADAALGAALAGQAGNAIALMTPVIHRPVPRDENYYELIRTGEIVVRQGGPDREITGLLIDGQLRELDETEIRRHLEAQR
jgi:hypothetical protein